MPEIVGCDPVRVSGQEDHALLERCNAIFDRRMTIGVINAFEAGREDLVEM